MGSADRGAVYRAVGLLLPGDHVGQARHRPIRSVGPGAARVPLLEERVEDLRAVLDSAGSDHAALFGISEGGPMNLLFAATYPDRTAALVLYGTSPKFSAGPDWLCGWSPEDIKGWLVLQP